MKKLVSLVSMLLLSQIALQAMHHKGEEPLDRLFTGLLHAIDTAQPMPESPTEALFKVARNMNCSTEEVQRLLDRGANADGVWANGYTPLFIAASRGNLPVCQLLLDKGARLKTFLKQSDGTVRVESALQKAAGSGNLDLVKLLISRGADLEEDALGYAAAAGHTDVCVYLIDTCKMSVQATYGYLGSPVLLSAIGGNHQACYNALLDRGANACAIDKSGDSSREAPPAATESAANTGLRGLLIPATRYVLGSLISLFTSAQPDNAENERSLEVPVQTFKDIPADKIVYAVFLALTKRHIELPKDLVLKIFIALQKSETIAAHPAVPYERGTLAQALRPFVCKLVHQKHCGFASDLTKLPVLLNPVVIELIACETLKMAADILRVPAALDSVRAPAGTVSAFDGFTYEALEAEYGKALRANIPLLLSSGKKQEQAKVVLLSE